jgi:uncharacterized membrane protein
LAGALLFGVLDIAAFFALSYWGLVHVPAGQAAVIGALLPLVTLFLAIAQGLERLGWRALAGGVVAVAGVALVSGEQVRGDVPLVSVLALLAGIVCGAEASIIVKRLPPSDPVATNAVAMTVGAVVLLALSAVSGETRTLPVEGATWVAFAYLVSFGTVGVFLLFLFILTRWQASAVSYLFVLAPFVSVALAAWLLGEEVTLVTAVGALLVWRASTSEPSPLRTGPPDGQPCSRASPAVHIGAGRGARCSAPVRPMPRASGRDCPRCGLDLASACTCALGTRCHVGCRRRALGGRSVLSAPRLAARGVVLLRADSAD